MSLPIYCLGVDISRTRTGWGLIDNKKHAIKWGAIIEPKEYNKVKLNDPEFVSVLDHFYLEFRDLLANIFMGKESRNKTFPIDRNQLKYIVIEDLNVEYNKMAKSILHYHAAVKIAIADTYRSFYSYQREVKTQVIHNQTVKSIFKIPPKSKMSDNIIALAKKLKISRPNKIYMVARINKLYGIKLRYSEDDEADGLALAQSYLIKRKRDASV